MGFPESARIPVAKNDGCNSYYKQIGNAVSECAQTPGAGAWCRPLSKLGLFV
jgi:hypothetical protein